MYPPSRPPSTSLPARSLGQAVTVAVLAVVLVVAQAATGIAQADDATVVAREDFEDTDFPCNGLLCGLFPTTSGTADDPITSDAPAPFRDIPAAITVQSNADATGATGPNPQGRRALAVSRPATYQPTTARTSVAPIGGSEASVDVLVNRDDVVAAELSVQMVEFTFTEQPVPAGTIVVAAFDDAGALLDEVRINAADATAPVVVSAPDGRAIDRLNVAGIDGSETLHSVTLFADGAEVEPPTDEDPSDDGSSGGVLCRLLGC